MKWSIGVAALLMITMVPDGRGESGPTSDIACLLSVLSSISTIDFCGEAAPIETPDVAERFEKEILLALWDKPQVILWLKRSRRYFPFIEKTLQERGMPDDLKYVAVIESALRRRISSKNGAVGFWQFIKQTGRNYGLVINERIDQRQNFAASTRAALQYLQDLYAKFGSWTLAVAAYNTGEKRVEAEILEQETKDYYQLYLPGETRQYVFRLLAVKLIFTAPEKFGFVLTDTDYYPPFESEEVQVICPEDVPLRILAQAAQTRFKTIKDLNPEILGHHLAPGTYNLLVPKGRSAEFAPRYEQILKKYREATKERVYIVKKGDNLTAIADRFGVPISALVLWNDLDPKRPIHPGDRLFVLPDAMEATPPRETDSPAEEAVPEAPPPNGSPN